MKKRKAKIPKPKAAVKKSSSKTPKSKPKKSTAKKEASSILKLKRTKGSVSRIPLSAKKEIQDLKTRLLEAEETLEAIRSGGVDALVVSATEGEQVYTLKGAEHPYRVFFETMNEGGAVISREGLILACNKSFEHMVGVDLVKLFGSSFFDFIPPTERLKIRGFLKRICEAKTGEACQQALRTGTALVASGGERIPVQLALSAVHEIERAHVCVVITDLTNQKRAEEILRRSHDDLELKVKERTAELEASRAELEANNEELRAMQEELENSAAELEMSNTELEAQNRELRRAQDSIRKLNDDLAERNANLESVNKDLDAFIYSVSHDLRTPLRSISGFIKILAEDYTKQLDAQGRDYMDRIYTGSEKMSKLIEDLLYLSRISRQQPDRLDFNISRNAASIVETLRAANPGRHVEVDIQEGLTAFADPGLTEIVLSNLLENAWKFTSKTEKARIEFGAFECGIRNLEFGMQNGPPIEQGKTIYYVRDNGAGFNPEYKENLFWPFRRLHSDREFEGTGIGLTIVDRVIRRHGGKIWAEGEMGKGATFFFTLN